MTMQFSEKLVSNVFTESKCFMKGDTLIRVESWICIDANYAKNDNLVNDSSCVVTVIYGDGWLIRYSYL